MHGHLNSATSNSPLKPKTPPARENLDHNLLKPTVSLSSTPLRPYVSLKSQGLSPFFALGSQLLPRRLGEVHLLHVERKSVQAFTDRLCTSDWFGI